MYYKNVSRKKSVTNKEHKNLIFHYINWSVKPSKLVLYAKWVQFIVAS